jgi:hypothetical protein
VDLVRDLLDKPLFDRRHAPIGCVDAVVLDASGDGPPRVVAMEVGLVTLASRVHPRIGRWIRALARRWSPVPMKPVRLPLTTLRHVGIDIELDVDSTSDPTLLRLEKWLRRHVVQRIPGGR